MNFDKITNGFGARFKAILKKHNITQAKFGDDTQTHKGQISRYIRGEKPSGDFIIKAVGYFPEDIQYLFFGNSHSEKAQEESANFEHQSQIIIGEIQAKLNELKTNLAQNQHN